MTLRNPRERGFTLVEILIVVVILGILAAIVIPQFTNANEAARSSSLVTQLQSIGSQLELYQLQHNGNYPTLAEMALFNNLVTPTLVDGTAGVLGAAGSFGPYMQKAPVNPFTAGTLGDVVVATGAPALTAGWYYNAATGRIRASLLGTKATELGLDDLVADGVDSDVEVY